LFARGSDAHQNFICYTIATATLLYTDNLNEYLSFINSDYSTQIKALCRRLNLSQSSFAICISVSKKTVSFWECNTAYPNYENYKALLNYTIKEISSELTSNWC
jgi:DNA-binding transcriptional regulator YiaG